MTSGFYDDDGGRDYDPPCYVCGKMQQTEANPGLLCEDCPACAHIKCVGLDRVPDGDWRCPTCAAYHEIDGDLTKRKERFIGGPLSIEMEEERKRKRSKEEEGNNGVGLETSNAMEDEKNKEELEDDEDAEDHKYTPVRGRFAGGTLSFFSDVKETFKCFRKYHTPTHEYRNLSYEMEEEFDRLYDTMVVGLFESHQSAPEVPVEEISAGSKEEEEEKEEEKEKIAASFDSSEVHLAKIVPCTSSSDHAEWRATVVALSTCHLLEELTIRQRLLLFVWLQDVLEQSDLVVQDFSSMEEENDELRYDLSSLTSGDHAFLPHRPAYGMQEGARGFGGQEGVLEHIYMKRDKKYARERLINKTIRQTVPGALEWKFLFISFFFFFFFFFFFSKKL